MDDFDRKLGLRLRKYRIDSGLSQTTLGEALGVSFQMVQKYEKGLSRVSGHAIVKLSGLLNVPVTDILGVPSPRPNQTNHTKRPYERTIPHESL